MKRLIMGLALLSTIVGTAAKTVNASGKMACCDPADLRSCGNGGVQNAEKLADEKAEELCGSKANRIVDYTLKYTVNWSCSVVTAYAEYDCAEASNALNSTDCGGKPDFLPCGGGRGQVCCKEMCVHIFQCG